LDDIAKLRDSDGELTEESLINMRGGGGTSNITNGAQNSEGFVGIPDEAHAFRFVPLKMGSGRSHVTTGDSAALLDEIGGLPSLLGMTERFYVKAFRDGTLDNFLQSRDDPHGTRFATWIHQKMGGKGRLWDADRRDRPKCPVSLAGGHEIMVNDRTSAHVAAWHSPKRPPSEVGRHFKLDECRVWMRLHFWAMRESGLLRLSPSFVNYYIRFLGHFIRIYESKAPLFARESFRWSAKQENIEQYLNNGCKMTDVLGLDPNSAFKQIPEEELNDLQWPYIHRQDEVEDESW